MRGSRIGAELSRDYRQYWGFVRKGHREVFFHADSAAGQSGRWHQEPLVVMSGGDQFFRVRYDVQTKRFSGLQVNAPE